MYLGTSVRLKALQYITPGDIRHMSDRQLPPYLVLGNLLMCLVMNILGEGRPRR